MSNDGHFCGIASLMQESFPWMLSAMPAMLWTSRMSLYLFIFLFNSVMSCVTTDIVLSYLLDTLCWLLELRDDAMIQ